MNSKYRVLISIIILLQPALVYSQSRTNVQVPVLNPFDEMLPVDFCEVTRNPHRYDGKIIRLRTIFDWNIHGASLSEYGAKICWDSMRVDFDCSGEVECVELQGKLRGGTSKRGIYGRSALMVVGRFKYRKLLTSQDVRLGLHRYELQISDVVEVLKIPDTQKQP